MSRRATDGGIGIDPTNRAAVREQLDQFAGTDAVIVADDGTLRPDFGDQTHIAVASVSTVDTGYVFRRP